MNDRQVTLVKESWEKVKPISDTAAELFYGRLFELDPSLQSLFKGDMKEQGEKLMKMISVAVQGLDKLDTIVPAVQSLGVRHAGYGVEDSHYDTVGAALIWTLQSGLGDAFDKDTETAWGEAYTVLATTMKDAAAAEVAAPVKKTGFFRKMFFSLSGKPA